MLHRHIQKNIAFEIPYPKIEKTVPQFLTPDQYNRLICHFSEQPDSSMGLRKLIIIMLHITTKKSFYEKITI
jgi:integrase/recombinase XerC